MANKNLTNARSTKNDEFYTQYYDIEKEINAYLEYNPDLFRDKTVFLPCDDPEWSNFTKFFCQNFERFGLKKLISTSYAAESKKYKINYQPTIFEVNDAQFDENKSTKNGKIFILNHDKTGDGKKDINDLEWQYLEGDGDFKSDEIKKLRDESDIIVTNPPFSMFREFLMWVLETSKQFVIIGSMNAITYKEVFPLIKEDKVWLGATGNGSDMVFGVPPGTEVDEKDKKKAARLGYVGDYTRLGNSCWYTNIDHGRRHKPLSLMKKKDIIKFGTKKPFEKYDNYKAIEVPYVKYIPSDYKGVMGVPISFLDKYSPEQFEIIGGTANGQVPKKFKIGNFKTYNNPISNGKKIYQRILIKHKKITK